MEIIYSQMKKMRNQFFQFLLYFLLLSFTARLYAVEVQLYQVELPTQNQAGNFDQAGLLKLAFQTVLVRISGTNQFLNTHEVTNALENVDSYIKQYSYHQHSASEKTIKVIFNESRVNALLSSVKQTIWGKNRPLTLIWLVGADKEPMLVSNMEKVLNQRAIPFVFPLMDLTDTALVSEASEQVFMGEEAGVLEQAAKRYSPDVILFGKLDQNNGLWQTHWRFININKHENTDWNNAGPELDAVLSQAVNTLTLKLKASNVALASTERAEQSSVNNLILTVSGNLDVQQYSKILEHLRRLPNVSEAEVAQIMPDKTLFELVTTHNKETLINAIADGQLLIKTAPIAESTGEDALIYEVAGVL